MTDLIISKKNEIYLKVECEPHIKYELSDQFTFDVPGAKFMPQFRSKYWDGKIRLFNIQTGEMYAGLLDKLISFCENHNYKFKFEENKYYGIPGEINESISLEGVRDYMKSICSHEPRDYQIQGVYDALKYKRKLIISPTASGKSLMIYSVVRYFVERNSNILLIVPTTSLVEQMYKDFEDYGWNSDEFCHRVYGGSDRCSDKQVTISTWQSIYKLDKSYFNKFDVVIGDEAHQFKSKSLISIMSKLHEAKYRFGFTGTLDGSQTHKLVLEGLFGPSYKLAKTEELIKQGYLSKLQIKILLLKHDEIKINDYEEEVQYLISNSKRNKFIKNLTLSLSGNTLVLFNRVSTHGQPLYELINSSISDNRKVFFIHGEVGTDERELVRNIAEGESDAIIVASYGTFSTGINIKNLHNVIFASPSKSRIRNLQSIGRALRKSNQKSQAVLYDIADDITYKSKRNYTLNHLVERIKMYNEEKFDYEVININLRKNENGR
jgi:superfamily II DNA or RNA helicase